MVYKFIHTIARVVDSRAFYIRFVMMNFMALTLTCFAFCVPRRTDVDTLFFQEFVDCAQPPCSRGKNTKILDQQGVRPTPRIKA